MLYICEINNIIDRTAFISQLNKYSPLYLRKYIFVFLLFIQFNIKAQTATPFVSGNIFQTEYFIENRGQFDEFKDGNQQVQFGIQHNGDHIYFNPNGFVWHLTKFVEREEKQEEKEKEIEERYEAVTDKITMQWLGANTNCMIESQEKSKHYFTYGEENLSSYGYKKIIYKNLYPNIDVEYIISDKGGIKYSLILNPGADLSQVKFKYSGKNVKLNLESDTLFIKNNIIDLVECGMKVYYNDGAEIKCNYTINNNIIGFDFGELIDKNKRIIIDPFVKQITTLTSGGGGENRGYDVDYDNNGNLFVYGGGKPFWLSNLKIAKYNPSGTLLWTFAGYISSISWNSCGTEPAGYWVSMASNFVVDKSTGKIYCGQAVSGKGAAIIRLDSSGSYDLFVTKKDSTLQEVWDMQYDCKTGAVYALGGGGIGSTDLATVNTKNGSLSITSFVNINDNGFDIVSSALDNNSNLFVLVIEDRWSNIDNHIFKLNSAHNGYKWNSYSGFKIYTENKNKPYIAYPYNSNGTNALYANGSYVYYYNGFAMKAFNKSSGAAVGQYDSITAHDSLKLYQSGIYVDNCNNVYLGGNNGNIKVFYFDGSKFNAKSDIKLSGMSSKNIHDIKYNPQNNLLYICGDSVVGIVAPSQNCKDPSLKIKLGSVCDSKIVAYITNPDSTALYSYIWTDTTTNKIIKTTLKSATFTDSLQSIGYGHVYKVDITENTTCGKSSNYIIFTKALYIDTSRFIQCEGDTITIGNNNYFTSGIFSDTLKSVLGCDSINVLILTINKKYNQTINFSKCRNDSVIVGGKVYKISGTYYQYFKTTNGCDSNIKINISIQQPYTQSLNAAICNGSYYTLNNKNYTTAGNYIDTLISSYGCDSVVNLTLNVTPKDYDTTTIIKCEGDSMKLGNNYYYTNTIYNDTLKNSNGCDSIATTILSFNKRNYSTKNIVLCPNDSIIVGNHTYKNAGSYNDTFPNAPGCDRILTTNITISPTLTSTINIEKCKGDSALCGGKYQFNTGSYIDTIKSKRGCDSIVITNLIISNTPIASFDIDTSEIDKTSEVQTIQKSQNAARYIWSFGNPNQGSLNQSTEASPKHNYEQDTGMFNICLWAYNDKGCLDSLCKSVHIFHDHHLLIPNVFTANGDTINDAFDIDIEGEDDYHLFIFNRWGEVVFVGNEDGFGNDGKNWNGLVNNTGAPCSEGTYYWSFSCRFMGHSQNESHKGFLTLIR